MRKTDFHDIQMIFSSVPELNTWFPETDGFPRPRWDAISVWIKQNVLPDQLDEAWQTITREWLRRTCDQIEKSYSTIESQHFHLLSDLNATKGKDLLLFLEQVRSRILHRLGDIRLPKWHGKH